MEYSDSFLARALPEEPPPFEFVPNEVIDEIERTVEREYFERAALVARSTQWTYAMFAELRLGRFQWEDWRGPFGEFLAVPGWNPAIGLLEPELSESGFGLTVYRSSPFGSGPLGMIAFTRLKRSFPVVLLRAEADDHSPPHPVGATSAAWAQCNRTRQWGILTAGHAVGSVAGRNVSLTGNLTGRVARSAHPVIDAAFVQTMEEPSQATTVSVSRFPAAGKAVHVACQSAPVQRTVVQVEDNMGAVKTLSRAALMFTDQCCSRGDSGALVQATGGDAVGLYLGSLKTPFAGRVGRVLSFEQALFALDVTAYS